VRRGLLDPSGAARVCAAFGAASGGPAPEAVGSGGGAAPDGHGFEEGSRWLVVCVHGGATWLPVRCGVAEGGCAAAAKASPRVLGSRVVRRVSV